MTDYSSARTMEGAAVHRSQTTTEEDARTIMLNRVSWGAVLAGVAFALIVQLLLSMLGIGLGIATLDPGTADNPAVGTFSIAAAVWYLISGLIAAFAGGYLSSRMSGRSLKSTGGLHGITTWAVTTLLVFYLLTTAVGSIIGGVFSGVASAVGGLGRTAGVVAQVAAPSLAGASDPFGRIEQQIRQSSGNDPEALRTAAVAAVRAAITGSEAQAQDARERATQALARAQNIAVEQAREQIEQYEQQYRAAVDQAKEQAVRAADATARVVSRGALFGFIGLVLGAVAAWFGGVTGTVLPIVTGGGARRRP
jgi:hypothetical protein